VKNAYLDYQRLMEKASLLKSQLDDMERKLPVVRKAPSKSKAAPKVIRGDECDNDTDSDSEDYSCTQSSSSSSSTKLVSVKFPKGQESKAEAWLSRDKASPETMSVDEAVKLGYLVQTGPSTYVSTPVDTDFQFARADVAKLSSIAGGSGLPDLTQSTTDLIKDVTSAVLAAKSNSHKK